MRPGPHVDALREIFARILEMEEPNRYITEMVTGNDVRYARPGGAHPLVGGFARDMALETGAGRAHLVELLRSGRPVLLDLGDSPEIRTAAQPWNDRIELVTAVAAEGSGHPDGAAAAEALLVRPDGFIAWAGTGSLDTGSLCATLAGWFGQAKCPTAQRPGFDGVQRRLPLQ